MRKLLIPTLIVIMTLLFTPALLANEQRYANIVKKESSDLQLTISNLKKGELKKEINNRLGSRDINDIDKIIVNSGEISNADLNFVKEDLINITALDFNGSSFEEKEMKVTFNELSKIAEFIFPNSKEGYKLVDNFFKDNKNLNKVDLNGVIGLGKNVFENTLKLKSIDLTNVTSFDDGAFINSGIESVIFAKKYDLPDDFFKDTKSLVSIDISGAKTIGKGVFYGSHVEFVKMPTSYALEGYTFAKTNNLASIDLSGATRLGEGDFIESSIEKVVLPKNYNLPDYYFMKTRALKSVDISNANDIGAGVFAFSNIENIVFPKQFKLSEGMLQYTEKLKEIDVSKATVFKEAVFAGSSLEKIILPERFETTNAMFGFMENLKSIDMSGAEFIGSNIFVKIGSNYDFYRKFFDGSDLVSNINSGIETIILGGSVPWVAIDSFATLNSKPPIVLLPKSKEWDGLANNLTGKENEIKTMLRYDSYTYKNLMISKNTSIQIGFLNPNVQSLDDDSLNVKYQWYFNDKAIVNGNQSTFTVDNFSVNEEGFYRLEISAKGNTYNLFDIVLEANELAIDSDTLHKGFFLNEKVNEDLVSVLYVKDEIKRPVFSDELEYVYDFSEIGNSSIKVIYTKDDLVVVADYPVKVANTLPDKIKLKKGKSFVYDPMIDSFEFILTANQKDFFEINQDEETSEISIVAKEKYKGELDYKFNERVGQISIEITYNLLWLWISLALIITLAFGAIIYLRQTRGMFKIKKGKKIKK